MHIPDGFLDLRTCVASFCIGGTGFALAARRINARSNDKSVPLLGVMSAFLLAGQSVNFPVGGGISGHLLGSTLAAIVLGPSGAALVVATVLFVQCFLFQDGGITTFAANFLNLGLVGVGTGYSMFRLLSRWSHGPTGLVLPAALASWISVVCASVACSFELASSGTVGFRAAITPMLIAHGIIGIGEALITGAIISFLARVRPDLIWETSGSQEIQSGERSLTWVHTTAGLALALGIALFIAPFSSRLPDGLQAMAESLNIRDRAKILWPAPMADYSLPGNPPEWMSVSLAVGCGVVLVFFIVSGLGRWLRRPRGESHAE